MTSEETCDALPLQQEGEKLRTFCLRTLPALLGQGILGMHAGVCHAACTHKGSPPIATAGDEEVEYVVLELPMSVETAALLPGRSVTLQVRLSPGVGGCLL